MPSSRTTRSNRAAALAAMLLLLPVLVAGCDGGEDAESTLTAEDLGPGEWSGPFGDVEEAEVVGRFSRCFALGGFFQTGGHDVLDTWREVWAQGQTLVQVTVDRYATGDPDLTERMDATALLDDCVVDEDAPSGDVRSASWSRTGDGTVVYEEHLRAGGQEWAIELAVAITDDTFVAVEVSSEEGAEAPDAVELLDQAVVNLDALPAPESGEA